MAAFRDEIFGPVLPLMPFDAIDEAFAMVNDSPYGLQAAIFTQDLATVMSAYRRLDVGTVVINHTTAIRVESLPFGGDKGSGNAREGIHDTLLDMSEARTLLMPTRSLGPRRQRHDASGRIAEQPGRPHHAGRGGHRQALRRHACAARRDDRIPRRRDPGPRRRERRRQEHADERPVRRDRRRCRPYPGRRRGARAAHAARRTARSESARCTSTTRWCPISA